MCVLQSVAGMVVAMCCSESHHTTPCITGMCVAVCFSVLQMCVLQCAADVHVALCCSDLSSHGIPYVRYVRCSAWQWQCITVTLCCRYECCSVLQWHLTTRHPTSQVCVLQCVAVCNSHIVLRVCALQCVAVMRCTQHPIPQVCGMQCISVCCIVLQSHCAAGMRVAVCDSDMSSHNIPHDSMPLIYPYLYLYIQQWHLITRHHILQRYVLQCVAACCSGISSHDILYYKYVCCSVLQCVAVCCSDISSHKTPHDSMPLASLQRLPRNPTSIHIRLLLLLAHHVFRCA